MERLKAPPMALLIALAKADLTVFVMTPLKAEEANPVRKDSHHRWPFPPLRVNRPHYAFQDCWE